MTQAEKDQRRGMVDRKYQEAKEELSCLKCKLKIWGETLREISDHISKGILEKYGDEIGVYKTSNWYTSIPTVREIASLLREIETAEGLVRTWECEKQKLGME